MKRFDIYISLIFLIKIAFIITVIMHFYLKAKGKTDSKLDKTILYWKECLEFIFIILMSLLLIYLFNPRTPKLQIIDSETRLLLYLFGFVLIITSKWDLFL